MLSFAGDNCGIFVFGGSILAKNPAAHLTFFYKVPASTDTNVQTEADLWEKNLPEHTGVVFDHHHRKIAEAYSKMPLFPTQAIHHLALEGLADSVEFRRLARKEIRRAKQHNLKHLYFPEAIFANPKTKKILQHLAGTQLQIITSDIPATYHTRPTSDQRSITIYHDLPEIEFLKKRVETLLGTKLKAECFQKL